MSDNKIVATDDFNIFNFKHDWINQDIRVVIKDNKPLFCLSDISFVLGYSNPSALRINVLNEFNLPKLELCSFDTGYGIKEFTMVTERQLYYILMRSDKSSAKPFRQWLYNEVIPSIVEKGSYSLMDNINTHAGALKELSRVALELSTALEKIEADKPKLECYDKVMDTQGLLTIEEFAKIYQKE